MCPKSEMDVFMSETQSEVKGLSFKAGPGVDLILSCFVVYSTRRFVLCLALCYFVLVFFSPFSIAITSLGEERASLGAFRTFRVWEGLRFMIVALPGLFSYLYFLFFFFFYFFFFFFFFLNSGYCYYKPKADQLAAYHCFSWPTSRPQTYKSVIS